MTCKPAAQEGNRRKSRVRPKPKKGGQRDILDAIERLTSESSGIPPSFNELAAELNITKATVQTQVRRMRESGLILPSNGTHRSIRIA
jgi:DNA-binding MarR family transcriptional regulator